MSNCSKNIVCTRTLKFEFSDLMELVNYHDDRSSSSSAYSSSSRLGWNSASLGISCVVVPQLAVVVVAALLLESTNVGDLSGLFVRK